MLPLVVSRLAQAEAEFEIRVSFRNKSRGFSYSGNAIEEYYTRSYVRCKVWATTIKVYSGVS
jgi:hypothetical protein